jgi:hypothetical protein
LGIDTPSNPTVTLQPAAKYQLSTIYDKGLGPGAAHLGKGLPHSGWLVDGQEND